MNVLPLRLQSKAVVSRFFTAPLTRLLLILHVSPNALTITGFMVVAAAAYLISEDLLLAGGIVMLVGAAMDMLDGAVARAGNGATKFGALLDSVTDRLGEAVVLFGLLVYYVRQAHEMGVYLVFGVLLVSMMVSYLRARAEGLGIPGDVGLMGRPERVVVLGVGLLTGFPLYALGIILVLAALTVVQRVLHVLKATEEQ